jgi:hypothetical protein
MSAPFAHPVKSLSWGSYCRSYATLLRKMYYICTSYAKDRFLTPRRLRDRFTQYSERIDYSLVLEPEAPVEVPGICENVPDEANHF